MLEKVDLVIVGAEGVVESGGIINKVGSGKTRWSGHVFAQHHYRMQHMGRHIGNKSQVYRYAPLAVDTISKCHSVSIECHNTKKASSTLNF